MENGLANGSAGAALPARERIMAVALELFARHGLEVGVRDIVRAANLKNISAIRYYFGSKEALVRAVIVEGARVAESWRRDELKRLLARGKPTLREVLRIMVGPGGEVGMSHVYIRLLATVILNNPELSPRRLAPELTREGYDACWRQVLKLVDGVPRRALRARFEHVTICILSVVATRAVQADTAGRKTLWASRRDLENFIDSLEGMVTATPS